MGVNALALLQLPYINRCSLRSAEKYLSYHVERAKRHTGVLW